MKTIRQTFLSLLFLLATLSNTTASEQNFKTSVLKESSETEGTMVYFQKPGDWSSSVNIYFYDSEKNNSWPGEAMNLVEGDIYSFLIPETYQNPSILFNADGIQAPDEGGFNALNNGLYDTSGVIGLYGFEDTEAIKTFYFTKPSDWGATINAYIFDKTGTGGNNAPWPGEEIESLGNDQYKYTFDCTAYTKAMVIFNDGDKQTPDLVAIHNAWYNASGIENILLPIVVSSFTTDVESPQLTGKTILLSASAKNGAEPYEYKFTATINEVETDLTTFQSVSSTSWIPSINGEYIIKVYVKDANSEIVESELSFTIDMPTGIEKTNTQSSSVYTNGQTLYINGEVGNQVSIMCITGAVVEKFTLLNKVGSTPLSPGMYIVLVENKATKVIIK